MRSASRAKASRSGSARLKVLRTMDASSSRIGIGTVALLVAHVFDRLQAATGQPGQFALDGAASGAGGLDQFVDGVAAPRLTEQAGQ